MHKNHKSYFWFLCVLCLFVAVPLPVIGQADIHRIRSNASIIPLERPKELEGNWWDRDAKRALNLRTSIIVDPSDGKVPPLTPQAQKRLEAERLRAREHPADGPEDRLPAERRLVFPMGGPPMLPSFYNNSQYGPLTTNYRIVQVPGYVIILMEIIHDARIIPIDGRPHLPSTVRQWLGDSRGHWERKTLVVDTTNFTNKSKFRGADENLHLTERFTKINSDTLLYEFTVDDPTVFTKPWKGEVPMTASRPAL